MAERNTFITRAEYAARIGVDRSRVTRYCQRGMPTHKGLIDPEEADWWREQTLDQTKPKSKVSPPQRRKAALTREAEAIEAAAKPASKPGRARPQPAAPALERTAEAEGAEAPLPSSGVMVTFPDGTSLDMAVIGDLPTVTRIDKFWAGELKRREAMQQDREHLPRADVEAATGAAIVQAKGAFLGLSRRLAGRLEGLALAERERVIQAEIRSVLNTLVAKLTAVAAGEVGAADAEPAEDAATEEGADDDAEE